MTTPIPAAGGIFTKELKGVAGKPYTVLLVLVDHDKYPFKSYSGLRDYRISNMKYHILNDGDVVQGTLFEHHKRDSKGNRQYRFHVDRVLK